MKDQTFHRLLRELKPFLRPYLEEHEVEIDERDFMCCISTSHPDRTPSMHIVPGTDETVLHCFGCGATYNIFHAANALEGMEDKGTGFIKETIPALAKKYKIEFDAADLELSEEAVEKYRYRQLYRDAADVLKSIGTHKHTEARGWKKEICEEHAVASVDWNAFKTRLMQAGGYDEEELQSKGIHRRLFAHHLITFTIYDERGRPSGFVARNVDFDKGNKATFPKYRNTNNEVPTYDKSKILYGLQTTTRTPERRLDIFEGYADWVTAQHYSHPCSCAMGGVAITLEHLQVIKDLGFTHINLIFDGDVTGKKRTSGYLDRYAGKIEGLKITVMSLPFADDCGLEASDQDPDNFFKLYGLKGFMEIEPMTAFDWRLVGRLDDIRTSYLDSGVTIEELRENFKQIAEDDLRLLVDQIVPFIMADDSPIERGRMCVKLARLTGVSEQDIREEVSVRSNRQVKDIGELLQRKLKYAGDDALQIADIISDAQKRVGEATNSQDLASYDHNEMVSDLDSFFTECDNPTNELTGWRTGWSMFDDPVVMGGVPKKGGIITLAGSPNHGKSAILMNLAKQLVISDNPGLSVLMWYLDDPRHVAWSKMLASMCCESILDCCRPDRNIYRDPVRKERFIGWRNFLRNAVQTNKLMIKGHNIGNDIGSLEYWIKYTQDSTGNDVVVFVDAVHDMITGTAADTDERIKFTRIYDWAQATTETMSYTFATCAHVTKSGSAKGKPEQTDLSETGKIGFASKMIGMVYSEIDYLTSVHRRDDAVMYWTDESEVDNLDRRKPIVEMNITKNKGAQFKGNMYFKHKSDACLLQPMTFEEVNRTVEANKLAANDEQMGHNMQPTENSDQRRIIVPRETPRHLVQISTDLDDNPFINPQAVTDIESTTL